MDKKGLSGVVTTVLIILLSIAAIFILWTVLKPAIKQSAGGITLSCVDVDLEINDLSCNLDTTDVMVTLNSGTDVIVKAIANDATGSINSTESSMTALETKNISISYTGRTATSASVAAIITTDAGTTQICPISDTKTCT